MTTITLPIWLLVTISGTPLALLIIMLGIRLSKRKRDKGLQSAQANQTMQGGRDMIPGQTFHNDLFLRQIDAVFDGLAALVETERHKLKRMVDGQVAFGGMAASRDTLPHASDDPRKIERNGLPDMHLSPDGAEPPGVSEVEAELAMKFKNMRGSDGGRAIEAVA